MKKIMTFIAAFLFAAPLFAVAAVPQKDTVKFNYVDARTLPVFGKICDNTFEPFSRLPLELRDSLVSKDREAVWTLGRCSSGEFVRFCSDAGEFSLYWTSSMKRALDNMSLCGVRGLALYVFDKGEWVYVGTARPNSSNATSSYSISCTKLKGQMREYMLYLSLYDGVSDLHIGIPKKASISAPYLDSPRAERPVVIYGTSIMQGASASHPGMCSSNMLSRMLNKVVINLGFSGNALLDYDIAHLMASYPDPCCFVMDNIPNGSPALTREKLEGFVAILREAHPDTPIVFVEGPYYPRCRFDVGGEKFCTDKNIALREVYSKMKKSGLRNTYYIKADKMLLDDNIGTIEGTHFTDYGFMRYCDLLYPVLKNFF